MVGTRQVEGILARHAVVHRSGSGRWVQRERWEREDVEGNLKERLSSFYKERRVWLRETRGQW